MANPDFETQGAKKTFTDKILSSNQPNGEQDCSLRTTF